MSYSGFILFVVKGNIGQFFIALPATQNFNATYIFYRACDVLTFSRRIYNWSLTYWAHLTKDFTIIFQMRRSSLFSITILIKSASQIFYTRHNCCAVAVYMIFSKLISSNELRQYELPFEFDVWNKGWDCLLFKTRVLRQKQVARAGEVASYYIPNYLKLLALALDTYFWHTTNEVF